MTKICLFFIAVFIFQQSLSQDTVPYNSYYDDGQLKTSGQLLVGLRVGEWKDYYASGQLSAIYSYTDDDRNKEYVSYYEDGIIRYEILKGNGAYISRGYYESGALETERALGDGYYKGYLEDGSLQVESNYRDGELEGVWKQYYHTGELEWHVDYVDGYREGSYQNFYKNGKLRLEGKMIEDKKDGKEKRYLENGQLEWLGLYKDDHPDDKWIRFDANGKEIEKIKYKSGVVKDSNITTDLNSTMIPDGVIERVPIYTGCEPLLGNRKLRKCMNDKISLFFTSNFNTDVVANSGVSLRPSVTGRQRINIFFKIGIDGKVEEIKAHASHNVLEDEAIRVINMLPIIQPGMQKGEAVIVPFALPIVFQVEETKKSRN